MIHSFDTGSTTVSFGAKKNPEKNGHAVGPLQYRETPSSQENMKEMKEEEFCKRELQGETSNYPPSEYKPHQAIH